MTRLEEIEARLAAASEGPWSLGDGGGLTGPTTPAINGPTCGEQVAMHEWDRDKSKPYPSRQHAIVSKRMETLAIFPGAKEIRDANAALFANAPADIRHLVDRVRKAEAAIEAIVERVPDVRANCVVLEFGSLHNMLETIRRAKAALAEPQP